MFRIVIFLMVTFGGAVLTTLIDNALGITIEASQLTIMAHHVIYMLWGVIIYLAIYDR